MDRTLKIIKAEKARASVLGHLGIVAMALALAVSAALPTAARAQAQCTTVLSGLRLPVGTALTDHGHLLVAESGDGTPNSGRISIVDRSGNRRTLIDGMPSAPADVGTPSGPNGMLMQGRALFVTMGTGDVGVMGPRPGSTLENLKGPSSPIFSSVLAMYFSAGTEYRTTGFTMTPGNQDALAKGRWVWLRDSGRNNLFIRMVTNFPNFIPTPLPDVPGNISLSNPFGIVGVGRSFFVTDGGRNLTWKVDRFTGAASKLVSYPDIPNPLFPHVGGPFTQAVPTGIVVDHGKLLVSLLRGAPFATGTSTIEQIDPYRATYAPLISNLTTAIGMIPLHGQHQRSLLVLEHSSAGPFFNGPGTVLQFDDPAGMPTKVADCLSRPTSMTLDSRSGQLYVTEEAGKLVSIPFP